MKLEFIKGRGNMALTVFMPYDCPHNCSFCTSKALYKGLVPGNVEAFLAEKLEIAAYSEKITDVVFTGGEPMLDLEMLERLVNLVPNKNVYINTLCLKEGFFPFVKLVNRMSQIKGVNISRHLTDPSKEANDQVEDWCLDAFDKPVRINCVLPEFKDNSQAISFICDVLERWNGRNARVNFRYDYTKMDESMLHNPKEAIADLLTKNYNFLGHGFCDVCDTLNFLDPATGQEFSYHRGLEHSCVNMRTKLIVNDAILMPVSTGVDTEYQLTLDWDGTADPDFEAFIFDYKLNPRKKPRKTTAKKAPAVKSASLTSASSSTVYDKDVYGSCGGMFGRCGM